MARLTLAKVNEAIDNEAMMLELVKGKGYFYFVSTLPSIYINAESVYVYSLAQMTLEEWVESARQAWATRSE